ncbi:Rho termination factor N-terminal domain-containing protein, partial [Actinomadura sp. NPDC049753]|uniref:Rho termination factor N-terminal domain-containing protein n=1 Tax=Actinomadura sp. NPDC049753 TaxID=3154739 RepID=UPI00341A6888
MSESSELLTDATSTETAAAPAGAEPAAPRRRRGTGLSAMVLPELKALASSLGITGTTGMRKSQLIAAIQEKQGGQGQGSAGGEQGAAAAVTAERPRRGRAAAKREVPDEQVAIADAAPVASPGSDNAAASEAQSGTAEKAVQGDKQEKAERQGGRQRGEKQDRGASEGRGDRQGREQNAEDGESQGGRDGNRDGREGRDGGGRQRQRG